jgi:hypothetical protein
VGVIVTVVEGVDFIRKVLSEVAAGVFEGEGVMLSVILRVLVVASGREVSEAAVGMSCWQAVKRNRMRINEYLSRVMYLLLIR